MASKTLNDLDPKSYPKVQDDDTITMTRQELADLVAKATANASQNGFRPRNENNKPRSFVYKLNLPVTQVSKVNGDIYDAIVLGEAAGQRRVIPLFSNKFGTSWNVKEDDQSPGNFYIDGFGTFEMSERPNFHGRHSKLLKPSRPPLHGVKAPELQMKLYPKDTNPKEMKGVISWGVMADGRVQVLEWLKP